ncbi:MAG: hypothetical protein ACREYE_21055 [Gammaproteobacteria bacterium]
MKKPTALGISRSGGARNPHVFQYILRFLRSGGTRPSFARDGFFTNSQSCGHLMPTPAGQAKLQRFVEGALPLFLGTPR